MSELKHPPSLSDTKRGSGLWISKKVSFGGEVETLGRVVLGAPDAGGPSYQFNLVQFTRTSLRALLHQKRAQKIVSKTLDTSSNPNDTDPEIDFITFPSRVVQRTAMASVYVPALLDVASVLNVSASNGLDISLAKLNDAPVSITGPTFTGSDLGFSSTDLTSLAWRTFAIHPTSEPNEFRIIGTADRLTTRNRLGDISTKEMYAFTLDLVNDSIVSTVERVSVDLPFDIHQIQSGKDLPLNGQLPSVKYFAAGRAESEYQNQSQQGRVLGTRPELATQGATGIWICDQEDLLSWRFMWRASAGIPNSGTVHVNLSEEAAHGTAEWTKNSRDVSVVFDESWQRLTFLGIDTDPTQDPLHEHVEHRNV